MASITITINGQKVPAQTGQTVLEAARAAGIDIPTLCHHPAVKPIGACRLCLVEIAGQRTLQPACTFPVADKMDVKTESPKVVEVRKFVMELIFSERNHFCMYCEMSGDCELQALAYKYGLDHMTYPTYVKGYPVDASPPYFLLDHNRCVLCRRCVRVCGELVANHTLDMRQRGASTMVHADMNLPLGQSSCIACGNCLDVCPTGALVDKRSAFMARNAQTEHVRSVCSQCSLGCGIDVVTRAGNLLRVQGDSEAPVNRGLLCRKGRFEPLYEKRTRLLAPLVRTRDGGHRQADWNEALQTAADRIRRTPAAKLGAMASTRATNEALYLLARLFVKELKAGQAGLSHPVAPVFSDKIPDRLEEIAKSDCVLVVGADPARDQPVASFFVKRALDAEGRVIVVGAPESALAELADESFGMEEIRKAVEAARAASRPAVLYGAGLSEGVLEELKPLAGKALLLPLQPGVNTFAAAKFGLDRVADPSGLDVLYVLAGEEDLGDRILGKIGKDTVLIVQGCYKSSLTDRADVVLPMAAWAERSGTLTNTAGLVQEVRAATDPAGSSKPDWEILSLLAERLGIKPGASLEEIAVHASRQLQ
jgi:formate dehydrogenase major subunit